MGLIKGSVGDRFVVPCVDLVITVTTTGPTTPDTTSTDTTGTDTRSTAAAVHRVAAADCQRMIWAGHRWIIGPGAEPAPAPSLWPGTQASLDAGYQWLEAPPWEG
jgi:hypothetical protein